MSVSNSTQQYRCYLLQHAVTHGVAKFIVNALEMIQIDHDDGEGSGGTFSHGDNQPAQFKETAAVEQSG